MSEPEEEEILVEEIMSTPPITVSPDSSASEVAKIMTEKKIGCVVVVENNRVVGIVTRRDLVEKILAKEKNPSKTKVREIMSSPVIYVEPKAPILEVAKIMSKHDIRHVPVLDSKGLVGVITDKDILSVAPDLIEVLTIRKYSS